MVNLLRILICLIVFPLAPLCRAEEQQPSLGDLVDFPLRAVKDIPDFLIGADPREHWKTYSWLLGLTAAMIAVDQPVIDESQRFARDIGLISADDDGRKTLVVSRQKIFGLGADLHIPRSPNTYMYYIGDGITSFIITGGLITYSLGAHDLRAMATASQLLEALALTGSIIITSKMASGRESPFRASTPGGKWRGFVGFKNYLSDVSKHDAYPSGHIATAMATVRVLAENYLEKSWIKPVGYSAMSLLMFAMLNNGVHWLSDYPLGIAIGYHAAGVVTDHHLKNATNPDKAADAAWSDFNIIADGERLGIQKQWVF